MCAAAEAVEEAFLVIDGEGWGFLMVERAQTQGLSSSASQSHVPADDISQLQPPSDLFKERRGKAHGLCSMLDLLQGTGISVSAEAVLDQCTCAGKIHAAGIPFLQHSHYFSHLLEAFGANFADNGIDDGRDLFLAKLYR